MIGEIEMSIAENYRKIREEIPEYVSIVLAGKKRTVEELLEVINAGATDIGENYVQEAEAMYKSLNDDVRKVRWHMIGPLQRNKVNKALSFFDVLQTVDSLKLAEVIDKRARKMEKVIPIYIEINSGKEPQKAGVMPENAEELIRQIARFENIKIEGLMTMGPRFGNPEDARPYFKETRRIFEHIKSSMPNLDMKVLSMGMTNSYKVAIEEGSNMVRIGTAIFGERKY